MKNFIYKTNQYLLEHYPNVWNTRIVWMLLVASVLNIIYFILGYLAYSNPVSLQKEHVIYDYFGNGAGLFGIVISIIMIVVWLVFLFKNNAFKSYYPVTKFNLWTQFIFYFIIIFVSITFYYAYAFGVKTYISKTYPDEMMNTEIDIINQTAPFFSQNIDDYLIPNRSYPAPFDTLYCEKDNQFINKDKPYISFWNENYQFFTKKSVKRPLSDSLKHLGQISKEKSKDGKYYIFYFKDKVVDVSSHFKNQELSYYNYSRLFYEKNNYSRQSYYDDGNYYEKTSLTKTYQLLSDKNPAAFKKLFAEYFKINNQYKINTNVTPEILFKLVYSPNNYPLTNVIAPKDKSAGYNNIQNDQETYEPTYDNYGNIIRTQKDVFYDKHITSYYLEKESLENVLSNIDEIKTTPIINAYIQVYLWIAFGLALLVFIFRITGLKPFIFSAVVSGVLGILIGVLTLVFIYITDGSYKSEVFGMYTGLILGIIIICIPVLFLAKIKKIITAVCINMTLAGIVPFVLLIIGIISYYQQQACNDKYDSTSKSIDYYTYKNTHCLIWIEDIPPTYLSTGLLLFGIIFIYYYSSILKKWKAMPE